MTNERAQALILECGYQAKERTVASSDGIVRHLTETMTVAEYDEVMDLWKAKAYGSFTDMLRVLAHRDA